LVLSGSFITRKKGCVKHNVAFNARFIFSAVFNCKNYLQAFKAKAIADNNFYWHFYGLITLKNRHFYLGAFSIAS